MYFQEPQLSNGDPNSKIIGGKAMKHHTKQQPGSNRTQWKRNARGKKPLRATSFILKQ